MSEDPKLPVVTAAVTPAPIPEGFTVPSAVALARDIAIEMHEVPIILKKHGITPEQYATIKDTDYFKGLVEQLAIEWHSPKSSQQRLAIQTSVGLEEVLPDVIARVKIKNEPLQGVAQMVKVLADICGANNQSRQQQAPGEKFKITINLGADTETYTKTKAPVIVIESPETGPGPEVQSLSEGFGALLTLHTEPEAP